MNIIIVGCGNETFETAEVLAENNSILLISHRRPAHLTELLEKEKNISFVLCDVTDLSAIRGKEIVLIPFKSRLFLILEACWPWLFQKLFK